MIIYDWSSQRPKRRLALFCVAYRMLNGQSRAAACTALGPVLKINRNTLHTLSRYYIKTSRKASDSA